MARVAGMSATPATYGQSGPRHSESYGKFVKLAETAAAAATARVGMRQT